MRKDITQKLCFVCIILSLVLMLTPWGVAVRYAPSPDVRVIRQYSYLMNPMLTHLISPLLAFISAVFALYKSTKKRPFVSLCATLLFNTLLLINGYSITAVSCVIEVFLATAMVFCVVGKVKEKDEIEE